MALTYTQLTVEEQERITMALGETDGVAASPKLLKALEADHFTRSLLGEDVTALEARIARYKKKPKKT